MKYQIYHKSNTSKLVENMTQIATDEIGDAECPNDSIDEIILDGTLSYCDKQSAINVLGFCIQKLRLGGSLIIKDVDIDVLTRHTFHKIISTDEFNDTISNKQYIHSLHEVRKFLIDYRIGIESYNISGTNYIIQCIKK